MQSRTGMLPIVNNLNSPDQHDIHLKYCTSPLRLSFKDIQSKATSLQVTPPLPFAFSIPTSTKVDASSRRRFNASAILVAKRKKSFELIESREYVVYVFDAGMDDVTAAQAGWGRAVVLEAIYIGFKAPSFPHFR